MGPVILQETTGTQLETIMQLSTSLRSWLVLREALLFPRGRREGGAGVGNDERHTMSCTMCSAATLLPLVNNPSSFCMITKELIMVDNGIVGQRTMGYGQRDNSSRAGDSTASS